MGASGKSDIWQAKTCRRKKLKNGDRRATPRNTSLIRELEQGLEHFWAKRGRKKAP